MPFQSGPRMSPKPSFELLSLDHDNGTMLSAAGQQQPSDTSSNSTAARPRVVRLEPTAAAPLLSFSVASHDSIPSHTFLHAVTKEL